MQTAPPPSGGIGWRGRMQARPCLSASGTQGSPLKNKISIFQLTALREAGCSSIFRDKASGVGTERKGLACAVQSCKRGDVLVVWKLNESFASRQ
jgi:hypothetical protein